MAKRKTRHVDESTVDPPRRSARNNAGCGGVAEQLQKLGSVFENPMKVAKRGRVCVPDSEPVNVFAPKEREVEASHTGTQKSSKKASNPAALRQLPSSSDEDQDGESTIPKPILYPAELGARFGFQMRGATAPSYVGTQTTAEYKALDQHAASPQPSIHPLSRRRSRSVTTPACPPEAAVRRVHVSTPAQASSQASGHATGQTCTQDPSRAPDLTPSGVSHLPMSQVLSRAPDRAGSLAPPRIGNLAPSRVSLLAPLRVGSLAPSRASSLARSRAGSLARSCAGSPARSHAGSLAPPRPDNFVPSSAPYQALPQTLSKSVQPTNARQRFRPLTIGHAERTDLNPESQPCHRLSSDNQTTKVPTSRMTTRKRNSLEMIDEVASIQRSGFIEKQPGYGLYVDDYDNTGELTGVGNPQYENSQEEVPELRTGGDAVDGVDESMYLNDASVERDEHEGEEEIFDLHAVESDLGSDNEEEQALTAAVIKQSTRCIRDHFPGREDILEDITMGDVFTNDLKVNIPKPRPRPRLRPDRSDQQSAQGDGERQEPRQEHSTIRQSNQAEAEPRQERSSRTIRQPDQKEAVNTDYDVLGSHHAKNRHPRVPSEVRLDHAQQLQAGDLARASGTANLGEGHHEAEPPAVVQPKKRAARATCEDPTLVRFYPRMCAAMINLAKYYFRCHQIYSDPFPSMHESLDGICRDVLDDAMVTFSNLGRKIEDGYWEEHKDDMAECIWKDINTFRSEVRKVILEVVLTEYELSAPHLKTSSERLAAIKAKAGALAHKFHFLQGPRDEQGRASNFAHNCLRVACHRIYYRKGSKSFRNEVTFKETVPYMSVLYVASYIKGVLDAYAASGTMEGKVSPVKNEEDFWKMHSKMEQVIDHEYHGPKLKSMLDAWAHEAYTGEMLDQDDSSECEIDLD